MDPLDRVLTGLWFVTVMLAVCLVALLVLLAERVVSVWMKYHQSQVVAQDRQQIIRRLDQLEASSIQAREFAREASHTTHATGQKMDEVKVMSESAAVAAAKVADALAASGPAPVVAIARRAGGDVAGVVVKTGAAPTP